MAAIRVAAGIIIHENRILIAKRKPTDRLAGLFEFPGGKIEPGETPEACLLRELDEELGLTSLTITGHYMTTTHRYPFAEIELSIHVCTTASIPTRLTSHELIYWVTPQELMNYSWAPADLPAVERLFKEGLPLDSHSEPAQTVHTP